MGRIVALLLFLFMATSAFAQEKVKISELPDGGSVQVNDIFPVVRGNKTYRATFPSLSSVAITGSYMDLSNKPYLGSLSEQDADNVSITGGSLANVTASGLSLSNITGSTQCLQVNSSGLISGTGTACGAGGGGSGTVNSGNTGQIAIYTATGTAVSGVTMSGDASITASGVLTLANTATARANLGLAIGTNVQAYNANLQAVASGTWAGATSITTVGIISTGTWSASTIPVNRGGTGATSLTGWLKGNGTSAFTATATLAAADLSGTVPYGTLPYATATTQGAIKVGSGLAISATGVLSTTGTGGGSGTVSSGNTGDLAYYSATGTTVVGTAVMPLMADQMGVLADATDRTSQLRSAIQTAASMGRCLQLPKGTILAATGTVDGLITGACLRGDPSMSTIIKMPNSANRHVLATTNADVLFASGTSGGSHGIVLENLIIDGNRSNNTSGDCIKIFGSRPTLKHVYVINCPKKGFNMAWGATDEVDYGMEGKADILVSDTTGEEGFRFAGPTDTHVRGLTVIDASQNTTNGYDGIYIPSGSSFNCESCHVWTRYLVRKHRYALNVEGSVAISGNSMFEEGNSGAVRIASTENVIDDSTTYLLTQTSSYSPVQISGYVNWISGQIIASATGNQTCVTISGDANQNYVHLRGHGCAGGALTMTSTGGMNRVYVHGWGFGGWPKPYQGTLQEGDEVFISGDGYIYDNRDLWQGRYESGKVYLGDNTLTGETSTISINKAVCGTFENKSWKWEVSALQFYTTTGGTSSNAQLAIYGPLETRGITGSIPLLARTATISTTTSGIKTANIVNSPATLLRGTYLKCINTNGSPAASIAVRGQWYNSEGLLSGGDNVLGLIGDGGTPVLSLTATMTYSSTGAWPSTLSFTRSTTEKMPVIGIVSY